MPGGALVPTVGLHATAARGLMAVDAFSVFFDLLFLAPVSWASCGCSAALDAGYSMPAMSARRKTFTGGGRKEDLNQVGN